MTPVLLNNKLIRKDYFSNHHKRDSIAAKSWNYMPTYSELQIVMQRNFWLNRVTGWSWFTAPSFEE
jgi:hypothetical protein